MPVTLRWFPNSWFEIVGREAVVHIDPSELRMPDPPADLKPADVVLVTHHHPDHCDAKAVARVAAPVTPVYAPELCRTVFGDGANIVRPGDAFDASGVRVRVTDAYNTEDGTSTIKAHERGECVGYVITIDGITIYHAGDTDFISEMMDLGPIDVALLPVGGTYTMNAEEAARAAVVIEPRLFAIPMHVRDTDPAAFARALEGKNVRVVVPRAGETIELTAP